MLTRRLLGCLFFRKNRMNEKKSREILEKLLMLAENSDKYLKQSKKQLELFFTVTCLFVCLTVYVLIGKPHLQFMGQLSLFFSGVLVGCIIFIKASISSILAIAPFLNSAALKEKLAEFET